MTVVRLPAAAAPRILMIAVEPSADAIGAALLRELRAVAPPGAHFLGVGGPAMEATGVPSLFPIDRLSVMGISDALRALPEALKRAGELAARAAEENIDAAIFVDAWGFSRLCAREMRRQSCSRSQRPRSGRRGRGASPL